MTDRVSLQDKADAVTAFTDETVRLALRKADPIPVFLQKRSVLSLDQCSEIVEEAIVLLEGLYVHLPLKRAMYAIDPVRRLRLLQFRIEHLRSMKVEQKDDFWFHRELSAALTSVRDLHTMYVLPKPFDLGLAFLPFQVEDYFSDEKRRFAVANVIDGLEWTAPADFKRGVDITYWNGIPIARAVELVGEQNAGGNPDARLARGLARLTIRPLAKALPPDEEWVRVCYKPEGSEQVRQLEIPWRIAQIESGKMIPPDGSTLRFTTAEGVDFESDMVRAVRKAIYGVKSEDRIASAWLRQDGCSHGENRDFEIHDLPDVPDYFQAKKFTVKEKDREYGYIRIRSFAIPGDTNKMSNAEIHEAAQSFFFEFIRILERLPPTGLIIDVRDNPGGTIVLGERLLQTLTPGRIQPQSFQFINTVMSLDLTATLHEYMPWQESIQRSMETKTQFSSGIPLSSVAECNDVGQKYHGPVVLVTNALCYSTTDIFAAGFQDHGIGPVLGTDGCTGAGGANVVEHAWLNQRYKRAKESAERIGTKLPEWRLKSELPEDANFRIALRRSLRVGKLSGTELEDFGVVPDERHEMTKNDMLNGNVDLMIRAAGLLKKMPVYCLQQMDDEPQRDGNRCIVRIKTSNIRRLNVMVDNWTSTSQMVDDDTARIEVPTTARVLDLRGYDGVGSNAKLVAARRILLNPRRTGSIAAQFPRPPLAA